MQNVLWNRMRAALLLSCVLTVNGCTRMGQGGGAASWTPLRVPLPALAAGESDATFHLHGWSTWDDLIRLLRLEYDIQLWVPGDVGVREVMLPGVVTEKELLVWIEWVTGCMAVRRDRALRLECGAKGMVTVPRMAGSSFGGRSVSDIVGGSVVAASEGGVSFVRDLLEHASRHRRHVVVRLVVLDSSVGADVDMGGSPVEWLLEASAGGGKVLGEWVLMDGGVVRYEDTVERRLLLNTVSGETGQTFEGRFDVLAAGVRLALDGSYWPAGYWRIWGDLEVSDFRGSGSPPEKVQRKVSLDHDLVPGSVVRLMSVDRVEVRGRLGVGSDRSLWGIAGGGSRGSYSLWLSVGE